MLERIIQTVKRLFGYPLALQKEQCRVKLVSDEAIFFCTRNTGHFGPHKTYRGKLFWIWK
tara:strand:- start:563 stop:742 length:180 start_codon:yes stop_codon:yes gene_type:complete